MRRRRWRAEPSTDQIEGRQRCIEMEIKRRLTPRLTIRKTGELFAVAEKKFNLETKSIEIEELLALKFEIS